MFQDQYDVTAVIHMHLVLADSTTTDVAVELGYRASDPYAVRADFTADGPTSSWLLARDVFCRGLTATQDAAAGEGDVSMWRDEDPQYLLMSLTAGPGTALLAAPARPVEQFLAETLALVPAGSESGRVDAALDSFVASILAF